MTLTQMATAVRNHVVDGLKGVSYTAFSMEQLKDEILLTAQTVLLEFSKQGILDLESYSQKIDGIKLSCDDLLDRCEIESDICKPHFQIPELNLTAIRPIKYIGTVDTKMTFKVYLDRDYRFHQYRLATAKAPFAWVSTTRNSAGLFDVFLFNMSAYSDLKFITIDAIFNNPYELLETEYFQQFSNSDFYAPAVVQDAVITKLTEKYIKYYRQFEKVLKPNTQE